MWVGGCLVGWDWVGVGGWVSGRVREWISGWVRARPCSKVCSQVLYINVLTKYKHLSFCSVLFSLILSRAH